MRIDGVNHRAHTAGHDQPVQGRIPGETVDSDHRQTLQRSFPAAKRTHTPKSIGAVHEARDRLTQVFIVVYDGKSDQATTSWAEHLFWSNIAILDKVAPYAL